MIRRFSTGWWSQWGSSCCTTRRRRCSTPSTGTTRLSRTPPGPPSQILSLGWIWPLSRYVESLQWISKTVFWLKRWNFWENSLWSSLATPYWCWLLGGSTGQGSGTSSWRSQVNHKTIQFFITLSKQRYKLCENWKQCENYSNVLSNFQTILKQFGFFLKFGKYPKSVSKNDSKVIGKLYENHLETI